MVTNLDRAVATQGIRPFPLATWEIANIRRILESVGVDPDADAEESISTETKGT